MQVKPQDLESRLGQTLAPIYLICGDEPLIVEESCDAIIAAAKNQGFTERSIHYVEGGFRWHDLANDAASMSLFAEKKLLDVRVPPKKFDKEAGVAIREWIDRQEVDQILLLRSERLETRQRKSAWFKAIEEAGVVSLNWAMTPRELPGWVKQRAQSQGVQLDPAATRYLVERVEGNLLAAAQEVDKLAVFASDAVVDLETMMASLEDASRYNVFDLLDAVMAGDTSRCVRILSGLQEAGVSVFAVLGALSSQLRRANNTRGLPPQRARALQQFVQRIRDPDRVLGELSVIDQQGKGQLTGDAWISLERLLLRLSGMRQLSLPTQDQEIFRGVA
ncbi:MAG: DNA polymerase III subunit delta [Pseudomonadota bacterium]